FRVFGYWSGENFELWNGCLGYEGMGVIEMVGFCHVDDAFYGCQAYGLTVSNKVVTLDDALYGCQTYELHISRCKRMKVIVKGEEECDATVEFPCLKSLKLDYLDSLEGFCLGNEAFEFPSLDTLEIYRCEKMTVFTKGDLSAPKLYAISKWGRKYNIHNRLNSFIRRTKG
ncbi:NB-ARC domains-containing protein, partial [Tanacetum coccineum]